MCTNTCLFLRDQREIYTVEIPLCVFHVPVGNFLFICSKVGNRKHLNPRNVHLHVYTVCVSAAGLLLSVTCLSSDLCSARGQRSHVSPETCEALEAVNLFVTLLTHHFTRWWLFWRRMWARQHRFNLTLLPAVTGEPCFRWKSHSWHRSTDLLTLRVKS